MAFTARDSVGVVLPADLPRPWDVGRAPTRPGISGSRWFAGSVSCDHRSRGLRRAKRYPRNAGGGERAAS